MRHRQRNRQTDGRQTDRQATDKHTDSYPYSRPFGQRFSSVPPSAPAAKHPLCDSRERGEELCPPASYETRIIADLLNGENLQGDRKPLRIPWTRDPCPSDLQPPSPWGTLRGDGDSCGDDTVDHRLGQDSKPDAIIPTPSRAGHYGHRPSSPRLPTTKAAVPSPGEFNQ